jgi:hypothetical protein
VREHDKFEITKKYVREHDKFKISQKYVRENRNRQKYVSGMKITFLYVRDNNS